MGETLSQEDISVTPAALDVHVAADSTVMSLKSWLPGQARGGVSVRLAGLDLPVGVGSVLAGPLRILCIAPGEWLVVAQPRLPDEIRKAVQAEAADQGFALVDLSSGRTVLDVSGPAARRVLSEGCGLDLHPKRFCLTLSARTRLAQIPVVVDLMRDPDCFQLYVERSHARYLEEWLAGAMSD